MSVKDPWQERIADKTRACATCGAIFEQGQRIMLNTQSGRVLCPNPGHINVWDKAAQRYVPAHQPKIEGGESEGGTLVAASSWSDEHTAQVLEVTAPWGWCQHLKVRRHDRKDGITWETLQAIKDELLGEETLAVEVYPPHERVVNETNTRHLWTVPSGLLGIGLGGPL